VRLGLHHVADALVGPAEILHLDRGTGGTVLAEMADPPALGLRVVGRSEYDQDGQILGDVKEMVVPAAVQAS